MQTLISVFESRGRALKARDRLVQSGFAEGDVHWREADGQTGDPDDGKRTVVIVKARNDMEAESAAVTLHECGAIEVEDRDTAGGTPTLPGVRLFEYEARRPDLADRAAQVSREMKEDREERAYAAAMNHVDRDRPK